jgi:hypothetical protein
MVGAVSLDQGRYQGGKVRARLVPGRARSSKEARGEWACLRCDRVRFGVRSFRAGFKANIGPDFEFPRRACDCCRDVPHSQMPALSVSRPLPIIPMCEDVRELFPPIVLGGLDGRCLGAYGTQGWRGAGRALWGTISASPHLRVFPAQLRASKIYPTSRFRLDD